MNLDHDSPLRLGFYQIRKLPSSKRNLNQFFFLIFFIDTKKKIPAEKNYRIMKLLFNSSHRVWSSTNHTIENFQWVQLHFAAPKNLRRQFKGNTHEIYYLLGSLFYFESRPCFSLITINNCYQTQHFAFINFKFF